MIVHAWRLVKDSYAADAFSGMGASAYGGRWNSPGMRAVYVSESLSLATLEILAGGATLDFLSRFVKIAVEFDDSRVLAVTDLPADWLAYPATATTRVIGDTWLKSRAGLVLQVPSAVVPGEFNYMINPVHPDAKKHLVIHKPEKYGIDPRLLQSI
jgi:RES domain-containing protein